MSLAEKTRVIEAQGIPFMFHINVHMDNTDRAFVIKVWGLASQFRSQSN